MSGLSLDLIPLILDFISFFPPEEARSTFRSLALVSSWSTPALSRLYHTPYLPLHGPGPTLRHANSLLSTLQSNPTLASAVRALPSLGAWSSHLASTSPLARGTISHWVLSLLRLCPNLTTLDFPWVTRKDAGELEAVLGSLQGLTELSFGEGVVAPDPWAIHLDPIIQGDRASAFWSYHQLRVLVSRWPRLRRLTIGAILPGGYETPFPTALEEFSLVFVRRGAVDCEFIESVLGGSKGSLRRLEVAEHQVFGRTEEGSGVKDLLEGFGGTLRELRTMTSRRKALSTLLGPITRWCPRLRTLELGSKIVASPDNFRLLAGLRALEVLRLPSVTYVDPESEAAGALFDPVKVAEALEAFGALREVELGRPGRELGVADEGRFWGEQEMGGLVERMGERAVRVVVHDVWRAPTEGRLAGR